MKEAVREFQQENGNLKEQLESMTAQMQECDRLQAVVNDLKAKLTDKESEVTEIQHKLEEQTSLVCNMLLYINSE